MNHDYRTDEEIEAEDRAREEFWRINRLADELKDQPSSLFSVRQIDMILNGNFDLPDIQDRIEDLYKKIFYPETPLA